MSRLINLVGRKFESLTVVERAPNLPGSGKHARWFCLCDCGGDTIAQSSDLISGHSVSCGCKKYESVKKAHLKNTIHGMSFTPLHRAWSSMKSRCLDVNHPHYKDYGGRGITICDKWLSFEGFREDMEPSYQEGLTLDRSDNNLGYSKDNCRWATRTEQQNNRRSNTWIDTPNGKMTVAQAAEAFGLNQTTLLYRIKAGWTTETLFATARSYG